MKQVFRAPVKYLRKIGIAIAGGLLVVLGVILLPLPGPGLVVIFAGLFVLSLEFEWVKPYLERSRKESKKLLDKARGRSKPKT